MMVLCLAAALVGGPARALDPTRSIAQFHHTSWTIADGMPANIWAIAQTPDGYLWLGSVDGLYRFDGVRVERIAADTLPSPSIHALTATASGGLWIGYERPVGVISYLHNGTVTNFRITSHKSTSVHAFAIGPDKTVWASTPDSILRFDGRRWQPIAGDFGFSYSEGKGGVWSFGVAGNGIVWAKNPNGLFYLKPGAPHFERATGYPGGPEGFALTRDGRLWTTDVTNERLYALADPTGRAAAGFGITVPKAIEGPILLDSDGTLWCTSVGGGGLRRVRTAFNATTMDTDERSSAPSVAPNGLSSNLVHTLFEDREGDVWIGTSLGLDRFRPANIVTETPVPSGFRARFVVAAPGALYAYSGWSGTASSANDGTQTLYRILPGQPPEVYVPNVGRLRGMAIDARTGTIWLMTPKGVQQLIGRTLGPAVALPDGVEGPSVFSAAFGTDGTLWISTFVHGVFFRRADGRWQSVPLRSPVGATGVLISDPGGGMWVRYSGGGLFRIRQGRTQDFSHNGLDIGDVTFIQPQGRGLIIGGENGIGSLERGQFHALRAASVPALSGVTGIANTPDGSSWIFAQAGILRSTTLSLDDALRRSDPRSLRFELYDSRDGLPGAPYGAVYGSSVAADPAGRVWFTTGNGLVWIDPANLHHNALAPNVVIDSLTADDRHFPAHGDVSLAAGTSNVEIEYTALSLAIPDRVRFRYKLDGIDPDWVEAGNRRQAFYTRLGPGHYSFHVIAANNDGVWNTKGATLSFDIPPTFLQSRLFMLLCAIAVALVLWLIYSARLAQIGARMRSQLEGRLSERERIARELHDTLLQGFQGLMLRFQSVAEVIPPDQPARQLLESAMDRGDAVLIEGRDRVKNLRALEPVDDLARALRDLVANAMPNSPIGFRVIEQGTLRALHPIATDEIIRIAREAILNAFRHARADIIEVCIAYLPGALRIRIDDDGIGIDTRTLEDGGREGHFGLIGMRERAAKIDAQILFARRSPRGTRIEAVVPAAVAYVRPGKWRLGLDLLWITRAARFRPKWDVR